MGEGTGVGTGVCVGGGGGGWGGEREREREMGAIAHMSLIGLLSFHRPDMTGDTVKTASHSSIQIL